MFLEVHTSFRDMATAKQISRQLIREGLAACVNLLPCFSLYRWKGKIEEENEVIGVFKTIENKYSALEERLTELHPYEVPMIVASKLDAGLGNYLNWLEDSLRKEE